MNDSKISATLNELMRVGGLLPALIVTAFFTLAAVPALAQSPSTDRDNPTPLTANLINGSGVDEKTTYFYSFGAEPGEVAITLDVRAEKQAAVSSVDLELFDAKSQSILSTYANPDHGATKRTVKTVKLHSSQTLVLAVTVSSGVDSFRIALAGALSIQAGEDQANTDAAGSVQQPAAQAPEANPGDENPTESNTSPSLDAQTISGTEVQKKTEYVYRFAAGPGEVTLTLTVKSALKAAISSVDIELLSDSSQPLAAGFANPSFGESKHRILTAKLTRKQAVVLKVTVSPGTQSYALGISGAIHGLVRRVGDPAIVSN